METTKEPSERIKAIMTRVLPLMRVYDYHTATSLTGVYLVIERAHTGPLGASPLVIAFTTGEWFAFVEAIRDAGLDFRES